MARGERQTVRKPAMKFAHLRKKISQANTKAGVARRAKKSR
jgi:hypothetical protein